MVSRLHLGVLVASVLLGCDSVEDERTAWLHSALTTEHRLLRLRAPEQLAAKYARMAAHPYDYLRGTLPLWVQDTFAPGGHGVAPTVFGAPALAHMLVVGDPHPENVGTFLPPSRRAAPTHDDVSVELNDFDAATHGPPIHDLRRLATALRLLVVPTLAATSNTMDSAVAAMVDGYRGALLDEPAVRGRIFEDLVRRAIDDRFEVPDWSGDEYVAPSEAERRFVTALLATWPDSCVGACPPATVKRLVRRLGAGVASLPLWRFYAELDGVVLEIKEAREAPVLAVPAGTLPFFAGHNAQRVVFAQRALQSSPDIDPLLGVACLPTDRASFRVAERAPSQRDFRAPASTSGSPTGVGPSRTYTRWLARWATSSARPMVARRWGPTIRGRLAPRSWRAGPTTSPSSSSPGRRAWRSRSRPTTNVLSSCSLATVPCLNHEPTHHPRPLRSCLRRRLAARLGLARSLAARPSPFVVLHDLGRHRDHQPLRPRRARARPPRGLGRYAAPRCPVDATRSASPESLFGIDGNALLLVVRRAYGELRLPLGPGHLTIDLGLIPDRVVTAIESTDLRIIEDAFADIGRFVPRSDLGARLGWSVDRLGLMLSVTNGEGSRDVERDDRKDVIALVEATPLIFPLFGHDAHLRLLVSGRLGTRGVGSVLHDRLSAWLALVHPRLHLGFEAHLAWGHDSRPVDALGLSGTLAVTPLAGLTLTARYDWLDLDTALVGTSRRQLDLGVIFSLGELFGPLASEIAALGSAVRLRLAWRHGESDALVAPTPGVAESGDFDAFILALEVRTSSF